MNPGNDKMVNGKVINVNTVNKIIAITVLTFNLFFIIYLLPIQALRPRISGIAFTMIANISTHQPRVNKAYECTLLTLVMYSQKRMTYISYPA